MSIQKLMTESSWNIIQHSWNETGIYSTGNNQRICQMNTEDWDVNEDNQDELETIQLNIAKMLAASPDMLKLLKNIQQDITDGVIQVAPAMQEKIKTVISKATIDAV